MVSVGEGENIIVNTAECIRLNKSCDQIKGVWLKKMVRLLKMKGML